MKIKEYSWLGQPDKIGMGNVKPSTIREMYPERLEGRFLHEVANFL